MGILSPDGRERNRLVFLFLLFLRKSVVRKKANARVIAKQYRAGEHQRPHLLVERTGDVDGVVD